MHRVEAQNQQRSGFFNKIAAVLSLGAVLFSCIIPIPPLAIACAIFSSMAWYQAASCTEDDSKSREAYYKRPFTKQHPSPIEHGLAAAPSYYHSHHAANNSPIYWRTKIEEEEEKRKHVLSR